MFSPYYAAARRRRAEADPHDHISINAILYGRRGKHWAMTERGRATLDRSATHLRVGPSSLAWTGGRLVIDIDEWTVPLPRRLRGRITVDPGPLFETAWTLDDRARHAWRAIAPLAQAEVRFKHPESSWQGRAYVDMNTGSEPLEAGFAHWNWSRQERGATTRILYDVEQRAGARRGLALDYCEDGRIEEVAADPVQALARTGWRVGRSTRAAAGRPARIVRTLEDTPFYSRSMLATNGDGGTELTIHESVDLDRFRSRWVQTLLPFKMPRKGW